MKNLISIKDLSLSEINGIFSLARKVKKDKKKYSNALSGKIIALVFQKPSLRTRVSFEVGIKQLGANSVFLGHQEINLGVREPVCDVAKTLSRYVDGIIARTFDHRYVTELVQYADVPVVNGLSDLFHPCQVLSDIFTIKEKLGGEHRRSSLAYIGDGNNICNSLLYACAKIGINLNIASPRGYGPQDNIIKEAKSIAQGTGAQINIFTDSASAAKDADILYTDVWVSMGQEKEREERMNIFKGFQINEELLRLAKKDCLIMHCLPAHRGEEITMEAIESKNSIVFDQAENRLHVQKAILIELL